MPTKLLAYCRRPGTWCLGAPIILLVLINAWTVFNKHQALQQADSRTSPLAFDPHSPHIAAALAAENISPDSISADSITAKRFALEKLTAENPAVLRSQPAIKDVVGTSAVKRHAPISETPGKIIHEARQQANASDNLIAAVADSLHSDGVGTHDLDDRCAEQPGSDGLGCPQNTDADRTPNLINQCPQQHSVAQYYGGCGSDLDSDGVADIDDHCPASPGSIANNGCKIEETDIAGSATQRLADRDADGIVDGDDLCPDHVGTVALRGCSDKDPPLAAAQPAVVNKDAAATEILATSGYNRASISEANSPVSANDQQVLNNALAQIEFKPGSAVFTDESGAAIEQIASLLQRYQQTGISIEGHTDSSGDASSNMKLSIERARACALALLRNGISRERITAAGFGESRPLVSNDTAQGRLHNRRVEFHLRFAE